MTDVQDPGSALLAPAIDTRELTCPNCGHAMHAPTGESPDHAVQVLIAVCDVLVVKALDKLGWYLLRADRGRFNDWGDQPYYLVHTKWPTTPKAGGDALVTKATKGVWDVVPLLLDTHGPKFDAKKAVAVLDRYVHDLAVAGDPHDLNVLAYRLRVSLGLPVFVIHPAA